MSLSIDLGGKKSNSFSWSCVHISVDGVDLFAGIESNIKVEHISNPGFIVNDLRRIYEQ